MDTAAQDLVAWRKEAGPKSKWSAHISMQEALHFTLLDQHAQTMTALVQSLLPRRWGLQDWVVKTNRMGDQLRWCGRYGNARGGNTIPCSTNAVAYFLGCIRGMAANQPSSTFAFHDTALEATAQPVFFNLYNTLLEGQGLSAEDAYARLVAMGEAGHNTPPRDATPAAAYTEGFKAWSKLRTPAWSLAPALYDRLVDHPSVKTLHPLTQRHPAQKTTTPWDKTTFDCFDTLFQEAWVLANAVANHPKGKKTYWLVDTHTEKGVLCVQSWSVASATLAALLQCFTQQHPPTNHHTWTVYATHPGQSTQTLFGVDTLITA